MSRKVKIDSRGDCFVSGAVAMVLHMSRVAGVAPLNFVKVKSGWRVSVSKALTFYGYVLVTCTILLTIGTLVCGLSVKPTHSDSMRTDTGRVVWVTDICLTMLIAGTVVYCAPGQMRVMIRYMNHLQKINNELNTDQWPMFNERNKIIIFIIGVICTVALICIDYGMRFIHNEAENWISVVYIFYYLFNWIVQLQQMQFIMITMHLLSTFKVINRNLELLWLDASDFNTIPSLLHFKEVNKEYIKSSKKIAVNSAIAAWDKTKAERVPKPTQSHHQTVHRLALVYAETCDVLRKVDRCYGLVLLMLLGAFLYQLVCSFYYFIYDSFDVEKFPSLLSRNIMKLALQMFWCMYRVCNLVMLMEPCHLTHVEIENTRELVGHLTLCTQSSYEPLAVELELFSRHFVLNQASYSPLKVTTMSRALTVTILGCVTTYLAIVSKY